MLSPFGENKNLIISNVILPENGNRLVQVDGWPGVRL